MKGLIYLFVFLMIVIGGLYGGLRYLNEQKKTELDELATSDSLSINMSYEDSLKMELNKIEQKAFGEKVKADSLQDVLNKKEKLTKEQNKKLNKLAENNEKESALAEKARTMAKTFEKMNVKQIGPILENLDDETVMLIYQETGNRFKKNILLAVNEKRAALITKTFINRN